LVALRADKGHAPETSAPGRRDSSDGSHKHQGAGGREQEAGRARTPAACPCPLRPAPLRAALTPPTLGGKLSRSADSARPYRKVSLVIRDRGQPDPAKNSAQSGSSPDGR
jgi:hypothetical protein